MRWGDHPTTQSRQVFFDSIVPAMVEKVAKGLPPWRGPRKLPGQFAFHGDDDVLVISSWPGATQGSTDEALAWGLAYGGDRDVVLVLPAGLAAPTLQRMPWVTAPVRVLTFDEADPGALTPAPTPARVEVTATVAGWGRRGTGVVEALGDDQAGWLGGLIDFLEDHPNLDARHRESYLAWHAAGRQILKITRGRSRLTIEAGVRYTKPEPGQPAVHPPIRVTGPISSDEAALVRSVVEAALARRHGGEDSGHEEHRLQHAVEVAFGCDGEVLGLTTLLREFPAWRPGRSPGFIDFLGAAADGRPHVVETKLDNDVMLALQGLDYWIWATANPGGLEDALGAAAAAPPVIDFVVGAFKTQKVVGPFTLRQLEALDGSIEWRFHVVSGWRETLQIESLPKRSVPGPPEGWKPVVEPRYAQRLQQHLLHESKPALLGAGPFFHSPQGGIAPEALTEWEQLQGRGRLHRYAHHVRSSQAFALNLLAGLDSEGRMALARLAGITDVVEAAPVIFEFEDPDDRLGEATTASPHRTQTDAAMICHTVDGTRILLLIEVKLSELDFGHCSAYESAANDRRDVCATDGPFGKNPSACFQLRNHDRGARRTYDVHIGAPSGVEPGGGCDFRLGINQPMRNVALGRSPMSAGAADQVVHALVAPLANRAIWRRWAEARAGLADIAGVALVDLPADEVLSIHGPGRADQLARRYQLVVPRQGPANVP